MAKRIGRTAAGIVRLTLAVGLGACAAVSVPAVGGALAVLAITQVRAGFVRLAD